MFSFLLNNKGELLTALDFIRREFDIVLLDRGSVQGANLSHLFGFVKEPRAPGLFAVGYCKEHTRGGGGSNQRKDEHFLFLS